MKQKVVANPAPREKIDGDTAAKLIIGSSAEPDHVGFDSLQAAFLKVRTGGAVSVAPEDAGWCPIKYRPISASYSRLRLCTSNYWQTSRAWKRGDRARSQSEEREDSCTLAPTYVLRCPSYSGQVVII
jgi:hypothetical protein